MLETVVRELGLALRRWRRRPATALLAVITMALAVGFTTALYSVYHTLVVDPLPYPEAERLVAVQPASLRTRLSAGQTFSAADAVDLRAGVKQLANTGIYYANVATLLGRGTPQHVDYANVSGEFFATLGVAPELGRWIRRGDEAPQLPSVAVLSDQLWRTRFGADPQVVGKMLDLDNRDIPIVGVMPAGFAYPPKAELWTPQPLVYQAAHYPRAYPFLRMFGRLAPGATLASAQAEATAAAQALAARYPKSNADAGVKLTLLNDAVAAPVAATLQMMLLAAFLVLAIACANVANLLLAGAVERWREMALRASLGASRLRLLGQLLVEAGELALAGGGAGLGLAAGLMPLLHRLRPASLPQLDQVHLDRHALLFAIAATVVTAIWFALAPAWQLLRARHQPNLLQASSYRPQHSRLPNAVVVCEVAATVLLLIGAGLFALSLRQREAISPGYQPDDVLSFRTSLLFNTNAELYAGQQFFVQLQQRLSGLPGVADVGMAEALPMNETQVHLRGYVVGSAAAAAAPATWPRAGMVEVTPGYFATMGIPVRGRAFHPGDGVLKTQHVAIISASLARRLFPGGEDPLLHSLGWSGFKFDTQILGVAGDVPAVAPGGEAALLVYFPLAQWQAGEMTTVVRTRRDPLALMPAVRSLIPELNPEVPIYQVQTLRQQLDAATSPDRFRADLLWVMSGLALCLAVAGLYGVLAHSVARRRQEIGIRMALGASGPQVRGWVLRQSLGLILAGLALGLIAAALLRPLLAPLLFQVAEVRGLETVVWLLAPAALLLVGLMASYWPARRASRLDPLPALRQE